MKITASRKHLKPLLREAVKEAPKECLGVVVLEKDGGNYKAVKGISLEGKTGGAMSPPLDGLIESNISLKEEQMVLIVHSHPDESPPHLGDAMVTHKFLEELNLKDSEIYGTIQMPEKYALNRKELKVMMGDPEARRYGNLPELEEKIEEKWSKIGEIDKDILKDYLKDPKEYISLVYRDGKKLERVELEVTE